MKKFLLSLVFGIGILFSMSSCVTPAYSQDVVVTESDGSIDISYVIRYGAPYYFEGSLLYYFYNGWYYYPYYLNNMWYYYRYERPFATYHGYRFTPQHGHRPYFEGSRHHYGDRRISPSMNNGRGGRGFGSITPSRPRSSTYMTGPSGRNMPYRSHSISPRTAPSRSFGSMGRSGSFGGGRSSVPSRSHNSGSHGGSRGFGSRK